MNPIQKFFVLLAGLAIAMSCATIYWLATQGQRLKDLYPGAVFVLAIIIFGGLGVLATSRRRP